MVSSFIILVYNKMSMKMFKFVLIVLVLCDTYVLSKHVKSKSARYIRETKSSLPLPGDCGIQEAESRIVGGKETELLEFPWMALLEYGPKETTTLACGGTLISLRFVLTAGHCVNENAVKEYGKVERVRLGEYNTQNETDCITLWTKPDCTLPIKRIDIESIAIHEAYSNVKKENDIAVIKMKEEVEYTEYVRPICLPTSEIPLPTDFNVAGWGKTEQNDSSVEKLKLEIPLYDKMDCAKIYNQLAIILDDGQICAGGVRKKDSCTGDSGGPLMAGVPGQLDTVWYQFGIVSFGPKTCGTSSPGVYTFVSKYLPWINEQINKL